VVILALLWALVLLPGAIRSRRSSPRTTVGGFEHAMDVLAHHRGSQGRELMVPRDATKIVTGRSIRRTVLERRRRGFAVLTGATAGSLLLSILFGSALWLVFLVSCTALGGYVVLLLNLKAQRQQAARVVRQLPQDHLPVRSAVAGTDPVDDFMLIDEPEFAQAAVGAESYGGLQVATRPDEPWQASSGVRIRRWDA